MHRIVDIENIKKAMDNKDDLCSHLSITLLKENHLDQIMTLQQVVLDHLDCKELMAPISREFMVEHINRRGFVLGALLKEQLFAFRIVYFPRPTDEEFNMGSDIGLSEIQREQVANLQMVAVHPRCRGKGLASQLNRIALRMLKENFSREHVFATVSPYNVWNIRILLNCGFRIAALKNKYGGRLRYVVYQNLIAPTRFNDKVPVYTELNDFKTQKKLLQSGCMGVALAQLRKSTGDRTFKTPILSRVIFKTPSEHRTVHFVGRSTETTEHDESAGIRMWHGTPPANAVWDIAGDPAALVDRGTAFDPPFPDNPLR